VAVLLRDVTTNESEVPDRVLESLATFARNSLPKYAVPVFLRVVTSVMATGNNKQQKHVLREQGVDPEKVNPERVFYLASDALKYEEFAGREWEALRAGKVKL
jgi:hypothetical protein